MSAATPDAIGVDIGVTNVKVAGATRGGEVLFRETFQTHASAPDWPTRVRANLVEIEKRHGGAGCVAVAAPGVARADGVAIRWMRGRLGEVEGLNWAEFLGRSAPVINDAQAALLGEAWLGAARGATNAFLLTLGTGVGGAAMVEGRLLRGHLGRAGHLGHICLDVDGEGDIVGTPGSLEGMIGNYSIGARTGGRYASTHDLVDAAGRGDRAAAEVWERSIEALACGVVSLINVLDPEVVIIGGGIAVAGEALFGPLGRRVREMEWSLAGEHVRIVSAALGEFAGAIGAARHALESSGGQ
jgi:glucokinase